MWWWLVARIRTACVIECDGTAGVVREVNENSFYCVAETRNPKKYNEIREKYTQEITLSDVLDSAKKTN